MKNITISTIAATALAVVTLGMAAPAVAATTVVDQIAASGTTYGLNGPGDEYDNFGVLGDRGPRTGIMGPGFGAGPDRPVYGPSADGR